MVIQCPQCQTRFRLADEKIKQDGIRVRCSKCREIFSVRLPEAPPAPAPGASFDSPPPEEPSGSGDLFAEGVFGERTEAPTSTEEPISESGFPAEWDSAEDSAPFDGGSELLFDDGEVEEEETAYSFEEEDAGEGLADAPFAPWAEEQSTEFPLEENGFEAEDAGEFSWNGNEAEDFDFDESESSEYANDEYDFGEITFAEDSPLPPPQENISAQASTSIPAAAPVPEPPTASGSADRPREEYASPPLPPRRSSPLRALLLLLVILLVGLSGAVGYFYWKEGAAGLNRIISQLIEPKASVPSTEAVRLKNLTSFFIVNRTVGQIFVIDGQAVNGSSQTLSAIAVRGILYNKGGKALLRKTAYCGNPLTKEDLHSLPFGKIEDAMSNQFGDSLSNLNVAGGKTLPFTIVFKNLPSDLSEYTVEVIASKPGSKS
jgi:predicted Zn finger-like uncharacterized protein